ncbi:hypothetical protein [uncultured Desulfosarcina sp.]|uniref:hypothetical protein n=1 Tax=uncultured Desulfosarcina sp. TaxID=218289 RepID=UPI0029C7709A|nr:hypothetical protein [uncultured Desulfosarcina sp.]
MSKAQLDREEYEKFFTDVYQAMSEKTQEKVTLSMILKRNNVEFDLPAALMEKIKPALEMDLNAPIEERIPPCGACGFCAICVVCAEANAISGLGALVGTMGLIPDD